MKKFKHQSLVVVSLLSFFVIHVSGISWADSSSSHTSRFTQVMNRWIANNQVTASDPAKKNIHDRDLKRQIRKYVENDRTLSMEARNVNIISQKGVVTLTGPVETKEEKRIVLTKAVSVAGAENVKDQIIVKQKSN